MSIRCTACGAVASYGREIGHKSDCPYLIEGHKFAADLDKSVEDFFSGETTLRQEVEKRKPR